MSKNVPGGYNGKLLRVDLSKGKTSVEPIDEMVCRRYIGGTGFATYYLWKELKPGIDALGPENKLVFALGPLSGIQIPGAARHCVGAKSPLTGTIAKSEVGGFWAAELKRAGFDVIIVEGKAAKPVYLWVQDGKVEIRDAGHLWGKTTKETQEAVREELGDKRIQLAQIGPGGENKVLYACVMHGLYDAAGRGGMGAVMGSKNLKAIAVRGHNAPKIANSERIKEIRQEMIARPHPVSQFGTGGPDMVAMEAAGNLPVRNFRDGLFPEVNQIHGGVIKDTVRINMEGCFACPIRCKKVVRYEDPLPVDSDYGGPEYETLASLGSNCGVGDLNVVCKGNEMCGAYSLDTISTGNVIAFAMECYEKGLLTTKDTGGIELKFGNGEAMLKAIELIARREGIGDLLAQGTVRMVEKIGGGSEEFAMQVKGLEVAMHDPRTKTGLGIGYIVNPNGGDHCLGIRDALVADDVFLKPLHPLGVHTPVPVMDIGPRKVGIFKLMQCNSVIDDSLVTCVIVAINILLKAEILAAVTGWDTGVVELIRAGERILTLARLFNIREGFTADDDVLPERFLQSKTDGVLADKSFSRDDYEKAKKYYYALMGWDANGVPLPERVEELEIE